MSSLLSMIGASLPPDHVTEEIPYGVRGTEATIEKMRLLARKGKRSARFREALGTILEQCEQKDYKCYAKAVHDFCTYEIKYVHDPVDVEYIESPEHVLRARIADCDSKCILFAALCENMGMPVEFVTVKGNPNSNEFSHVYCRVKIPGHGWIASDTTMPNKPFGWEPKGLPEKRWPLESKGETSNMNALICDSGMSGGVMDMQQEIIPLSGVGGNPAYLGAMGDADSIYDAIVAGSTYRELRAAKDKSNQQSIQAGAILNAANQISDPSARATAMQKYTEAQSAVTAARNNLYDAIASYNSIAQTIQTGTLGLVKPPQLAGIPLILAGIAVAVLAFEKIMAAWRNTDGVAIQKLSEANAYIAEQSRYIASGKGIDVQNVGLDPMAVFKASGKTKDTLVTIGLIGGVVLLGSLFIRKLKSV